MDVRIAQAMQTTKVFQEIVRSQTWGRTNRSLVVVLDFRSVGARECRAIIEGYHLLPIA